MHILALYPGFGNTKVCLDGMTTLLQSAISRPHPGDPLGADCPPGSGEGVNKEDG